VSVGVQPTADEMLAEVGESRNRLQARLLRQLRAEDVSDTAKVPFNVVMCREVLARRILELAPAALQTLAREQFAATALLTRAVVETGAALWYLAQSVKRAEESGESAEVRERVVKLLHGSRTTPEAPAAISVLTFVDALEKHVEGVRQAYDRLSEMAHPNWAGTLYLFGTPDREARSCVFGPSADVPELRVRTAAVLSGTLLLVEAAFDRIAASMPRLVAICERELGAA
jgi:hypothetical protein